MPLPQRKLDDKTFDVLVEESTKLIPRYAPEWTDHNRHDPGITLIELFAWLTEMQQFYLDSVGPQSYLKFLKLLGARPAAVGAASTEIDFSIPVGESTLVAGINSRARSLTVFPGEAAKFPPVPFAAIIWNRTDYARPSDDPDAERVRIVGRDKDKFEIRERQEIAHNKAGKSYGIVVAPEPVLVPRLTKLTNNDVETEDQVIFETASPLLVLPIKLKRILTSTRRGLKDNTGANNWDGLTYFAFGEEAEAESKLYLGFDDRFPAGEQIALTFDLSDDYEVPMGRHGDEEIAPLPSALVVWEYYNAKQEWAPLEISATIDNLVNRVEETRGVSSAELFGPFAELLAEIENAPTFTALENDAQDLIREVFSNVGELADLRRFLFDPRFLIAKGDSTLMLLRGGRLFFRAPADMRTFEGPSLIESNLFWVRATLREPGYELPPRVDSISHNRIDAFQRDTIAEAISFSSNGKAQQSFPAATYLAAYATSLVQVREDDGLWKDWEAVANFDNSGPNDLHYVIDKNETAGTATITFGNGAHGRIPDSGDERVRLISYLPDFAEEQMLGSGNGLPGQTLSLQHAAIFADSLKIQVRERVMVARTVTETIKISCLATFTRTTTPRANNLVEVAVSIAAHGDLCEVSVSEELHGDLSFALEHSSQGEASKNRTATLEAGPLVAGSVRKWPSYYVLAGSAGGSIGGQIKISIGARCPDLTENSPISIVDRQDAEEQWRWRDWIQVEDFDSSGANDPHFVFDTIGNTITFGDGINGAVPETAAADINGEVERNIRILALQTCAGKNGNVSSNTISQFAKPTKLSLPAALLWLRPSQVLPATGGKPPEALAAAQARVRAELSEPYQAVTSEDFESLAIKTPGLRVARAKAIPCFPTSKPNSQCRVTVVVLPYSLSPKPVPSANFLLNVCKHLDRHRLITTQVEVVEPNYVRVRVRATVLPRPGFDLEAVRQEVIKTLNRFLRPVPEPGDRENVGWPFGRTIFKSEIYERIEKVEGVNCVESVALTAEGSGATRDANGNISITPTSVAFSGDHQVEIVTAELECRSAT